MTFFQVRRKTLVVERSMSRWQGKLLRIDHRFTAPEKHTSTLVTGKQTLFALVKINHGRLRFSTDSQTIYPPSEFVMILPPNSLVRLEFEKCQIDSTGFLARESWEGSETQSACIFESSKWVLPENMKEVHSLLNQASVKQFISVTGIGKIRTAKQILDACDDVFSEMLSITHLAKKVGCSRESLSRSFKHTYGLSPMQYRLHVRVMNAVARLAEGEAILNVAFDVGFRDLSRFYKQFGKIAAAPPKTYHLTTSQNAKT